MTPSVVSGPTRQAIIELMRAALTDIWLDFARKAHASNPARSTEEIFEFQADSLNYEIAGWLAAAELLYIAELEVADDDPS